MGTGKGSRKPGMQPRQSRQKAVRRRTVTDTPDGRTTVTTTNAAADRQEYVELLASVVGTASAVRDGCRIQAAELHRALVALRTVAEVLEESTADGTLRLPEGCLSPELFVQGVHGALRCEYDRLLASAGALLHYADGANGLSMLFAGMEPVDFVEVAS